MGALGGSQISADSKEEVMKYTLSEKMIQHILAILEKGDRIELIPAKDKIKVVRIKRQDVTG